MAFLTMRGYARHRGVTVQAVANAVKAGRISCVKDDKGWAQIDPEVADKQWVANTDPSRIKAITSGAAKTVEHEEPAKESPIQLSSTMLKSYQARLAKLEFDERQGQLHSTEECKKNYFKIARLVRDGVMGISDRLSAELAAESDQFEIRKILDTEHRKVLEFLMAQIEGQDVSGE